MKCVLAVAGSILTASLSAGCMDTQTASLGVEARRVADAASAPGDRDASAIVADAGSVRVVVDAAMHSDDDGGRPRDAHADELDAGSAAKDAGRPPSIIDAAPVVAAAADAGIADGSVTNFEDRDAAHEDAKVPVNPLCIAEPWHCP